jgi:hypothetical protein
VLFAEVARGGRDNGAFADYDFAILPQGLTNVILADEICRGFS